MSAIFHPILSLLNEVNNRTNIDRKFTAQEMTAIILYQEMQQHCYSNCGGHYSLLLKCSFPTQQFHPVARVVLTIIRGICRRLDWYSYPIFIMLFATPHHFPSVRTASITSCPLMWNTGIPYCRLIHKTDFTRTGIPFLWHHWAADITFCDLTRTTDCDISGTIGINCWGITGIT